MAEAHSAGAVGTSMELRSHAQRTFFVTEDGATLRCSCFIPRPKLARRLAARWCTRAAHDLSYALYPFSYLTIATVVAVALVWPAAGEAQLQRARSCRRAPQRKSRQQRDARVAVRAGPR